MNYFATVVEHFEIRCPVLGDGSDVVHHSSLGGSAFAKIVVRHDYLLLRFVGVGVGRASARQRVIEYIVGLKPDLPPFPIRVIQRRAYGLRDEEYLRLKVLTCRLPAL